jgi:hypothetical protein
VRETIETIMRGLLLFWLLVGAAWSFDMLLVIAKVLCGYIGVVQRGAPFPYCVDEHDDWPYDEHALQQSGTTCDGSVLAMDLAVLAVVAIYFAVRLKRALRSDRSHEAMVLHPEATRRQPPLRALARRSTWCLVVVVIGSLLGLGVIFGPLGWSCGARLRRRYHLLGRPPSWMATTAWVVGPAVAVTVVVCAVGVLASAAF